MTFAIVPYRPEFRGDFERLNRLWLEGGNLLEDADLQYLQNPQELILDTGGEVLFALSGDDVVGTCAAIRMSDTTFELAKLSVDPSVHGRGLGRTLCEAVLEIARKAGAAEVVLTSHTSLVNAIKLYESLGFRHEALPPDVRYETANVFMRLKLLE